MLWLGHEQIGRPCLAALVAGGVLLGMSGPAQADTSCGPPPALAGLAETFALLPRDVYEVPPVAADRLAKAMQGLSEGRILRELQDSRMEVLDGIALELMAEGMRLSTPGAPYDARHLRSMVREFDTQSGLACQQAEEGRKGPLPDNLAGIYTEGRVDWNEIDRLLRESKTVSGGAVLFVMLFVIGLLFAADMTVRWIWTLVYNRRACRVPVVLELGGQPLPGLLLTLGRGGFRFHPRDPLPEVPQPGTTAVLDVPGVARLTANLSRFHETMGDFRLEHPLPPRNQDEILALSTISPYYIRKSRRGSESAVAGLVTPAETTPAIADSPKPKQQGPVTASGR